MFMKKSFGVLVTAAFVTGGLVAVIPAIENLVGDSGVAFATDQVKTGTVTGTILETVNASGYTYMLVENSMSKDWVAVPANDVKVGESVTYVQGMTMNNFFSKTLDRTFEAVIFSEGIINAKAAKPQVAADASNSFADAVKEEDSMVAEPDLAENPNGSTGAVTTKREIVVEKAAGDNGYTVAEIFEEAKNLDKKTVRVSGKVIKINMNIMGKHWIHLQDGTGNPMKNSHDLVITTLEPVEENSIITLEGVVTADKDFGAGYSYVVILEDGKVVKQ